MTRLLIASDCAEQLVGINSAIRRALGWWAQRILWHVRDDDILVLPAEPDPGHLSYIAELTGTRYDSLRVVVPPPGRFGAENLTADRLANAELHRSLKEALAGRPVDAVLPLCADTAVAALARSLGVEDRLPGAAFASQGGGALVNSKAVFRAVAAGAGVPIPAGAVTSDPQDAEELLAEMLLGQGVSVIAKKEFDQACNGNEVLSRVPGVEPLGARRGLVLPDRAAVKAYVTDSWSWLTNDGHHQVVLERYFPGSVAVFAEFEIGDRGIDFSGQGEMIAVPIPDGQVIPPVGLDPTALAQIVDGGRRLSQAVHAMGYRGNLSADAIVTADGTTLFTEYNGRITGSTHIYATVGARVVGPVAMRHRVLRERRGWSTTSFQAAVDKLEASGLGFDRETRTGVVLTGSFVPTRKVVSYTVVAEDLAGAARLEEQLDKVSPRLATRAPVVSSSVQEQP